MHYEAILLDLDGVVYIGADALPYAVPALNSMRDAGTILAAATNNANRPGPVVAEHLQQLGLAISAEHVMTSAQAAGTHLGQLLPRGATVLAVGGEGVAQALIDAGLVPLRASEDLALSSAAADSAAAVLVGYGPQVAWFDLAAAHWAIERGKPWVATNTDPTVPLPYGRAPGNGAIVGLLQRSTGIAPTVIGKPKPALFNALAERLGTRDVLVIGDRLDTDIDGALAAGMDSLLVCTGVHDPSHLSERAPARWPDFIAQDLRSLHTPVVRLWRDGDGVHSDGEAPLVTALLQAATGAVVDAGWRSVEASPLVDVRALRAG